MCTKQNIHGALLHWYLRGEMSTISQNNTMIKNQNHKIIA